MEASAGHLQSRMRGALPGKVSWTLNDQPANKVRSLYNNDFIALFGVLPSTTRVMKLNPLGLLFKLIIVGHSKQ